MSTRHVFFIDSAVADDQTLIDGLPPDSDWVVLAADTDGVAQMALVLADYRDLNSVQVISHGSVGALYLGNATLDADNLTRYSAQLLAIGQALSDNGDLLLYGCHVGAGEVGRQFVSQLAVLTSADIAASTDATGGRLDQANWVLELNQGAIDVKSLTVSPGSSVVLGVVNGTAGNDTLSVSSSTGDFVYGNAGDDVLQTGAGKLNVWDYLYGGDSSNQLTNGSDAYVIRMDPQIGYHQGLVQINDFSKASNESDTLDLTGFVSSINDMRFSANGDSFYIEARDGNGNFLSGTQIYVSRQFSTSLDYINHGIEFLKYGQRTVNVANLSTATELAGALVFGATDGNDTITGSAQPDQIHGLGGNDWLYGTGWGDRLEGGAGDDVLSTGAGKASTRDYLYGGNDTNQLTNGSDTYVIRMDPQIGYHQGYVEISDFSKAANESDTLDLTGFVSSINDMKFSASGDGFIIQALDANGNTISGTYIDVPHQFSTSLDYLNHGIEFLKYGQRTANVANLSTATEFAGALVFGATDGNDTITGSAQPDQIHGLDGNDWLYGTGWGDRLEGGAGDDVLSTGAGKASTWDYLYGGNETNQLTNGSDTYVIRMDPQIGYHQGYVEISDFSKAANESDTLDLTGFVSSINDMKFSASGDGFIIQALDANGNTINGTHIQVNRQFSTSLDYINHGIEFLKYGQRTVNVANLSTAMDLAGALVFGATDGNDTITGSAQPAQMAGLGGNDILNTSAGKAYRLDYLYGGNETNQLTNGSDTYVIRMDPQIGYHQGYVEITDSSKAANESDTLDLTGFVSSINDMKFSASGDTLVIQALDANGNTISGTHIQVNRQFSTSLDYINHGIEFLKYGQRTVNVANLSTAMDLAGALVFGATDGNDTITGSAQPAQMAGLGGNDILNTSAGKAYRLDYLYGGNETNQLTNGSDTYVIRMDPQIGYHQGYVEITDSSKAANESDTLDLTGFVSSINDMKFSASGDTLVIQALDANGNTISGTHIQVNRQFSTLLDYINHGIEFIKYGNKQADISKLTTAAAIADAVKNNMVDVAPVELVDQAGNSRAAARNIVISATAQTWSDWVGSTDLQDFYSFTLGAGTSLSATLNGLNADADLQLLDGSGVELAYNSQDGTTPETISMGGLGAGTYYLVVTGAYVGTNYNLSATATAAANDVTAPTVASFSPSDEASGVAVGSNIVVTFSEPIQRGIGKIVLKTAAGATVASYNATTSTNLSISGTTLTINPSTDLAHSTGYKVEFAPGSIKDLADNGYTGTTSYNFKTASQSLQPIAADLIATAANLAARAYQNEHFAANGQSVSAVNSAVSGWSPLDRASLGYDSGDAHLQNYADSHLLRYDNGNASATVGLALLNGKRTLGLSFEGTNFPLDDQRLDLWDDIVSLDNHAAKLGDFMQRVDTYAQENAIEQVLVTGHSLGGAMAQEFMSRYGSDPRYVGVTFGSPGTPEPNAISADRMLNIVHEDDLVPFVGQHGVSVANTALTIKKVVEIVSDAITLASLVTPASVAAFAVNYFIDALAGEALELAAYKAIGDYFGMSAAQAQAGIDAALARDDYQVAGSVMTVNLKHQDEMLLDFWWLDEHAMFFTTTANPDVTYKATANLLLDSYSDAELFADLDFLIGTSQNDELWSLVAYDAILGGSGNDTIYGSIAADRIICGPGNDIVRGDWDINGIDVCVYPGSFSDYQWSRMGNVLAGYYYQVLDTNSSNGNEGTDKLYAIEQLLFDDASYYLTYPIFGIVADGYIAGAALYIDTDADGIADPEENTGVVTDALGNFSLETSLSGALIAIDGTNIDTGLPNTLQLSAPQGSSVVNPLTTLVQLTAAQQGISAAEAEQRVQTAVGISADVDLTQYDPLAQAAGDADALAVQQVAAQVATLVTLAPQGDTSFASIAAAVANAGSQPLDLGNPTTLQTILPTEDAATLQRVANINQAIADTSNRTDIATVQETALNDSNDAPVLLTPLPDQGASTGIAFAWTFPANSFADMDVSDTISYSATPTNGAAWPMWLTFNPATRSFVGTPGAGDTGISDLTVTAKDTDNASATDTFRLTVSATDSIAPTVTTFSPADEATNVAVSSNILVTFSEVVQPGTGNIVIKTAVGATVATYDAATSANLSIEVNPVIAIYPNPPATSTLTINPSIDLAAGTTYLVEFTAGSIQDLAGNPYAGTTSYNFTTAATAGNPKDSDFLAAQFASPSVLGAGLGDDTYLLSSTLLLPGKTVTLSDTVGVNSIQLAAGLAIASSKVMTNTLQLTLSTGAVVNVLGADKFGYEVGGNSTVGINQTDASYASFVQNILGVTMPTGTAIAAGGALVIGGAALP